MENKLVRKNCDGKKLLGEIDVEKKVRGKSW
jgi:hypothetical protein